ncbi:hypothetical protein Lepto7376_3977 [[Leptolyngbya] sp. PCC 7376]|uniref:hypothetical protein n=1 Tax=[Leptolyngbya] sp. PCC 7376 TaxID=111781 RepID=UPI00029F38A0|nr:hypothetical protein [[Leptolyngbya] sp. PCC 7376]AFY40117.1 hypothetical protein Lepto7376_3977 [[Leptolyngbya] sp. PCC 7376]
MDNESKGLLILILPFAMVMTFVVTAWPLIVLAIAFSIAWRLWQEYQWQQLSLAINPDFRRLIESNQGKITVADLALETGLSGGSARWFLTRKAKEYGAQAIAYENRGIIYYFLTVSALGNMFDDSDPDFELEEPEFELDSFELADAVQPEPEEASSSPNDIAQLLDMDDDSSRVSDISSLVDLHSAQALDPLIQADLAKRLDVHPSTLRKRRTEEGFLEWSRSKDPQNVGWEFDTESRQFLPKV